MTAAAPLVVSLNFSEYFFLCIELLDVGEMWLGGVAWLGHISKYVCIWKK